MSTTTVSAFSALGATEPVYLVFDATMTGSAGHPR